jgi:uncharacterized membrane protein YeaQ/YmgE (transglycosylase-associated protein family)
MIEILCLLWFCRMLASIARDKGRSGAWGALGAVLWIGGEIGGAVVGALQGGQGGGLYLMAILGAAVGATIAYALVAALPPRHPVPLLVEQVFD